jgi:hypothetical protein
MPKRVDLTKTLSLLPIQTGIAESRSRYRLRRAGHYWRYSFSENNEIIYLKNYITLGILGDACVNLS